MPFPYQKTPPEKDFRMPLLPLPDSLFPSSCLLCHGSVHSLKPLCDGCLQELPWNTTACLHCAIPLDNANNALCSQCRQIPPVFQRAFCAFRYAEPVAGLLNRYKHNGQLAGGHWLAHSLADAIGKHYRHHQWPLPDCIVPVPLHWRRLRHRGFDQGLETGKVLARRLGLPLFSAVHRQRHTDSQQALSREQRQQNLAGAFVLRQSLAGRHVALVDDVLTTGSTATELTLLLQASGVLRVDSWAIARTP